MKRDGTISERTLIPLGAIGVVAGFVFWLTSLYNKTEANAQAVEIISNKQESHDAKIESAVQDIRERVIRIETEITRSRKWNK